MYLTIPSKASSVGSKNRNPGAVSKHCHFSRFSTMVTESVWAAAAVLCSHSGCVSDMLSMKCDGTLRGSPLFPWNLWTIACQCTHTKSSHDVSNLLLLPANYSVTQETFVPLMCLSCPSHGITSTITSIRAQVATLWVFRRLKAEERTVCKWVVRKRSDKRNEDSASGTDNRRESSWRQERISD